MFTVILYRSSHLVAALIIAVIMTMVNATRRQVWYLVTKRRVFLQVVENLFIVSSPYPLSPPRFIASLQSPPPFCSLFTLFRSYEVNIAVSSQGCRLVLRHDQGCVHATLRMDTQNTLVHTRARARSHKVESITLLTALKCCSNLVKCARYTL